MYVNHGNITIQCYQCIQYNAQNAHRHVDGIRGEERTTTVAWEADGRPWQDFLQLRWQGF